MSADGTPRSGGLFVVSGPSGVGKGTLVSQLAQDHGNVWVSVSATTRQPREGEVDGKNYFFLTKEQFEDLIEEDGFVEWAQYQDNYYGTPIAPIEEHLRWGEAVILEIEVQGAFQIRERFPDATLIFIEPPSIEELRRRLKGRGTESDEAISGRLETAMLEMERKMEYDVRIVNDDITQAVADLAAVMHVEAETK